MKKSILLVAVLMALVSLCLVFASCDSGSSDSDAPTPPPEPAPVTYTVSFYANGGSGTMDSGSVVEGETYTIPENKFTEPAGTLRSFAGWNTKADGSGTAYAAGATIESVTANITLYAQWTKPLFSVSATKKVYFSKGNLYYDGNSWNFENNQYDFRTYEEKNSCINGVVKTDGTPSDNWGLFGWSTDGTGASANYKPWGINTSTNYSDYSGDFKDWGSIESLPGNNSTTKVWRTLSKEAWMYLLGIGSGDKRTVNGGTGEGYSYQRAKINSDATGGGVYGMILYPDDYTEQTTATGYTSAEWLAMEAAGCVFLPAAGYRGGSDVGGVGSDGYYWSATADDDSLAYSLYFDVSSVIPAYYNHRDFGFSVRLVCVVEN